MIPGHQRRMVDVKAELTLHDDEACVENSWASFVLIVRPSLDWYASWSCAAGQEEAFVVALVKGHRSYTGPYCAFDLPAGIGACAVRCDRVIEMDA